MKTATPDLSPSAMEAIVAAVNRFRPEDVDAARVEDGRVWIAYGGEDDGVEIAMPPEGEADAHALLGCLYAVLVAAGAAPTLTGKAGEPALIAFSDRARFEEGPTWLRIAKAVAAVPLPAEGKPSRAGGRNA